GILGGARLPCVRDRGSARDDFPIPREADREPAFGVGDRPHPGLGPDREHRRQHDRAADQNDQPSVSHRGESISSPRPDNSPPNANYHFGRGRFNRSDQRGPTVQTINGSGNPLNYVRETSAEPQRNRQARVPSSRNRPGNDREGRSTRRAEQRSLP